MRKTKDTTFVFMKKSKGEKIVHAFVFVFFAIYALTLLTPLFWLIQQSFHPVEGYLDGIGDEGYFAFPKVMEWGNYGKAFTVMEWEDTNMFGMLMNSLWFIVIANTWCIFWPVMVGYIFAKYSFVGKNFIHTVVIFTLTVPVVGVTGAMIKIVTAMGLYDTGPLFVIVTGVGGFSSSFLIYYAIFKGLSWSYAESVFIDGGGDFRAFISVMLPMALPAISAMMVTGVISAWNTYEQFMYYLPSTPPVALGLYYLSERARRVGAPIYYAGLMMSCIPVLIIYALMADKMMKNLTIGGLKG